MKKMNSLIDAKLKGVNRDIDNYHKRNRRDFSKSFDNLFKIQLETINERSKLRSKFKYTPPKNDAIVRMRDKARKLRKY